MELTLHELNGLLDGVLLVHVGPQPCHDVRTVLTGPLTDWPRLHHLPPACGCTQYRVRIAKRKRQMSSAMLLYSVYRAHWVSLVYGRTLCTLHNSAHTACCGPRTPFCLLPMQCTQWKEPNSADDICCFLLNILPQFIEVSRSVPAIAVQRIRIRILSDLLSLAGTILLLRESN